jgi:hypothetical protein
MLAQLVGASSSKFFSGLSLHLVYGFCLVCHAKQFTVSALFVTAKVHILVFVTANNSQYLLSLSAKACLQFLPGFHCKLFTVVSWLFLQTVHNFCLVLSRKNSTVEGGTTRGTTALVCLQLHSSLYAGTVHELSSVVGVHPTILTAD